jgi:hypothetical protein
MSVLETYDQSRVVFLCTSLHGFVFPW